MTQRFSDGARAELAATVNSTDTTITITANGSLFPVANTDTATIGPSKDWFKLVLQDDTGWEIVHVRTHTAGSLTFSNVLRGRDGSTAREFLATSVVGQRPTAGDVATLVARMEATSAVDNTSDIDKPVSTTQKALISAVAADYYGDVDPTTDSKITVGPGFKWAHAAAEVNKVRNAANDGWVVTSVLFAKLAKEGGDNTKTFKAAPSAAADDVVVQSQVFGVGQTRQDLTASRPLNTNNTNLTGKPITVSFSKDASGPNVYLSLEWGAFPSLAFDIDYAITTGHTMMVQAVIMPGESYKYQSNSSGGTRGIWEIR